MPGSYRQSRVTSVEADRGCLLVCWQSTGDAGCHVLEQHFDRVVLAVSPDVAARVFWPLASTLHEMPTKRVESYILSSEPGALSIASGQDSVAGCSHHCGEAWPAQVITVRTQFDGDASRTQALHAMPGGALVSTCPLEPATDSKAVLRTASFTRTLRTTASRAAVQSIMGLDKVFRQDAQDEAQGSSYPGWVNGEDNVWLAGSWCWDGMVLLEGCVVSAMRVAENFGVRIPWRGD
ncbi:hypothetical protein HRG_009712 [Hirsutella rhossiliensis]|uniref:Amine oxidase domain-containing protein n=2 Tax=Hirsutella TaxID=42367 RepID=A0A0F7ZJC9_9HYPO|nr:uncharacterized protein HRG_09712 [Hirsutella rhossiliensis]KAH0959251.1 hypothetical protein HRG_09712 [Hirsutella rhossiliensis]KJZ69535.1 hypothetical protein HIM_11077 [Hirsutella minnesotensis 3608]